LLDRSINSIDSSNYNSASKEISSMIELSCGCSIIIVGSDADAGANEGVGVGVGEGVGVGVGVGEGVGVGVAVGVGEGLGAAGGGEIYSYILFKTAATIPFAADILTKPAELAGMVRVMVELSTNVTEVLTPLILITVDPVKSAPEIVTMFPPSVVPETGLTLVIVGITSSAYAG
jgi:hypothetical protein